MHTERLHALDALRAWALLLGIALHGAMSFFIGVPAVDNSPSTTLAVIFFVIHMFRMSIFFFIAGFFSCMMLQRRGWRDFMNNRLRRIALPLVVFWFVVIALTVPSLYWGLNRSYPPETVAAMTSLAGIPLMHLWFLYYLLIFYAVALLLHGLLAKSGIGNSTGCKAVVDVLHKVLAWPLAPVLLGLPVAWQFLRFEGWNAWTGIPTHDTGLSPWLSVFVSYGTAFLAGWLVYSKREILDAWQRYCHAMLVAALLLSVLCLKLAGLQFQLENPNYFDGNTNTTVLYAGAYALAQWCWCIGLTGLALRYGAAPSPLNRYLADASYWLYLMHVPVMFFLQVLVMHWPLHWIVKYPLILGLTLTILLAMYRQVVRPGPIGQFLNGKRYSRMPNAPAQPAN